jgi:hypothetical protein
VRAASDAPGSNPTIPPAAGLPRLFADLPVSDGAMRAFKRELESGPERLTAEPGSLAGSTMDVAPSSRDPLAPAATGRDSTPAEVAAVAPRRNKAPPFGAVVVLVVIVAALIALARSFVQ